MHPDDVPNGIVAEGVLNEDDYGLINATADANGGGSSRLKRPSSNISIYSALSVGSRPAPPSVRRPETGIVIQWERYFDDVGNAFYYNKVSTAVYVAAPLCINSVLSCGGVC